MSGLERITALSAPPVIGRRYLVPVVWWGWLGAKPKFWPVFPNLHEDTEHFNFPHPHYHVDPRFIDKATWGSLSGGYGGGLYECQSKPLSILRYYGEFNVDPQGFEWRAKTCQRDAQYVVGHHAPVIALKKAFAGRQCAHSRSGWVCPHRNYALGTIAPDAGGVITCPLHGLRVMADTGRVIA